MKLTMLGTGNALVTEYYNTCFIMEENNRLFMVDGGGGNTILRQIKHAGYDWMDIRHIFVTHKHNGREIGSNKITFGFREFISKKSRFEGELSELDLSKAVEAKDTFTPEWFRGASGTDLDLDALAGTKCLAPVAGGIISPVDGVSITNMGFIDNKLHIQVYYEDIKNYDDHGFITLRDKSGKTAECFDLSFWDDNEIGSYDEIIFDITPDEINNYTAFGEFVTCSNKTEGFWQVTFPLENIN